MSKTILLTGTFHTQNWIVNKIKPLIKCKKCSQIYLITTYPVPKAPKLTIIAPPQWLCILIGNTPARLFYFFAVGISKKPDFVGGYHLLFNGLAASILSRLIGARSIYFNTGGLRDVIGGGYLSGSFLFNRLQQADSKLEKQLLNAIKNIDIVIARGPNFISFLECRKVYTQFEIISGGIEGNINKKSNFVKKEFDLIYIGRIEKVKRLDLFIDIISQIKKTISFVSAVIVGDGSLANLLKKQTTFLGLDKNISFIGYQKDVSSWLQKSKIFLLTSDSEGLSQALLESMCSGIPSVVSDVGEHSSVINSGKNGYLVKEQTPEAYVKYIIPLLLKNDLYKEISLASLETSKLYDMNSAVKVWEKIF